MTTDDTKLSITHIGKTTVCPNICADLMLLQNVYHVPGMKKNLLSVVQLTSLGRYVLFDLPDVRIYHDLVVKEKISDEAAKVKFYLCNFSRNHIYRHDKEE